MLLRILEVDGVIGGYHIRWIYFILKVSDYEFEIILNGETLNPTNVITDFGKDCWKLGLKGKDSNQNILSILSLAKQ